MVMHTVVWYGGAAAIRGGQAGGGSHSAGCAVHPTSTPVQPTSITTSSQQGPCPIQEVRACSAPVKSRCNSKTKSNYDTNGGLLDSNRHYLFQLRTENTSRQDFQFSLLPATSVARGKKLVKTLREWKHEKLSLITVYQEVTLSSSMSDQSKITAAELPRSGPARSSTNRFSFADQAPTAENAAT